MAYMFRWNVQYPHGPPLAGVVAWIAMALMLFSALIRRKKWEVFLLIHLGSWVVLVIFAILHYETLLVMVALPMLLYTFDIVYRKVQTGRSTVLLEKVCYLMSSMCCRRDHVMGCWVLTVTTDVQGNQRYLPHRGGGGT